MSKYKDQLRLHTVLLSPVSQGVILEDFPGFPVDATRSAEAISELQAVWDPKAVSSGSCVQSHYLPISQHSAPATDLANSVPASWQGHPYYSLVRAIEDPTAVLPLGRMVSDLARVPHDDLDRFMPVIEASFRHVMVDLRVSDLATDFVNPWVPVRAAALYSSLSLCLKDQANPCVKRGQDFCDEVVQVLTSVAWIKYIKLSVIPVLKQYHSDASADDSEPWHTLISLMECGVESLVKAVRDGRSDVCLRLHPVILFLTSRSALRTPQPSHLLLFG